MVLLLPIPLSLLGSRISLTQLPTLRLLITWSLGVGWPPQVWTLPPTSITKAVKLDPRLVAAAGMLLWTNVSRAQVLSSPLVLATLNTAPLLNTAQNLPKLLVLNSRLSSNPRSSPSLGGPCPKIGPLPINLVHMEKS